MEVDEPIGEQIAHMPDKVWRVWAVTIGFSLILGRFFYVQETHTHTLSDVVQAAQLLKTELESVKTQTQTYQEAARERMSRIESQLDNL